MELTREQAIEEHRKMWRWLAEYPEATKTEYVMCIKKTSHMKMLNGCFLCTYARVARYQTYEFGALCKHCPLDWGTACCYDDDALFTKWLDAESLEERAKFAKQIAELPEREVKGEINEA